MMYRINTIEPLWWGLFGAGGFVAALLLPVTILIFGWSIPMGGVPTDAVTPYRLQNVLTNPIVKLYLLVLISLPLFHWAHRFRYFLFDLGLHGGRMGIAVLCYGAAIVGTVAAVLILIRV
jgi:fumarate reductase subunit D